jgi:hypothetical protein
LKQVQGALHVRLAVLMAPSFFVRVVMVVLDIRGEIHAIDVFK